MLVSWRVVPLPNLCSREKTLRFWMHFLRFSHCQDSSSSSEHFGSDRGSGGSLMVFVVVSNLTLKIV